MPNATFSLSRRFHNSLKQAPLSVFPSASTCAYEKDAILKQNYWRTKGKFSLHSWWSYCFQRCRNIGEKTSWMEDDYCRKLCTIISEKVVLSNKRLHPSTWINFFQHSLGYFSKRNFFSKKFSFSLSHQPLPHNLWKLPGLGCITGFTQVWLVGRSESAQLRRKFPFKNTDSEASHFQIDGTRKLSKRSPHSSMGLKFKNRSSFHF